MGTVDFSVPKKLTFVSVSFTVMPPCPYWSRKVLGETPKGSSGSKRRCALQASSAQYVEAATSTYEPVSGTTDMCVGGVPTPTMVVYTMPSLLVSGAQKAALPCGTLKRPTGSVSSGSAALVDPTTSDDGRVNAPRKSANMLVYRTSFEPSTISCCAM